jgi:hypothetical protein
MINYLVKGNRKMSFAKKLTDAQMRLARRIEKAGLTTISQAVKAFERQETEKINAWKKQLAELENKD